MSTVPVTIKGMLKDIDSGNEEEVTLIGELWITGLTVDGGPIIPPDQPPDQPPKPGVPTFPIWGPPGMEVPDVPGYPPVAGHPLPKPPEQQPPQPPAFIPIWHPDYGWIAIPAFPHPAPSKQRRR
jgi:hypothetical protein